MPRLMGGTHLSFYPEKFGCGVWTHSFMRRWTFALLLVLFVAATTASCRQVYAAPQDKGDPVTGFWYTEGHEGGVELYGCADKICGRFAWLKPTPVEGIAHDDHNPDPTLRKRVLCHLQFMGNFTPDGHGHYEDGWIYSPRHGQNFNAEMTLIDSDTLDLHGYVLAPILGESQTWTRSKNMPACGPA